MLLPNYLTENQKNAINFKDGNHVIADHIQAWTKSETCRRC